jgi:nitrate reductase NapE component
MSTHVQHDRTSQHLASGLVVFAAVMMVVAGFLDLFRGIMGVAEDDVFVSTPNYIFKFDLTTWGWIHLIFGALAIIVGMGLFRPAMWARVAGVGLASLLLIANFLSIPYYPLWSIVAIAMYGFIIWALCTVRPDADRRNM